MSLQDGKYSYTISCDEYGEYHYYIEAIDSSENHNKGTTKLETRKFVIPKDYDGDGLEDKVEIQIGGNPRDKGDVFNVTIGGEIGYLVKKENGDYIYWNERANEIRDTTMKDRAVLFDSDGDGKYDHYYDLESEEIGQYAKGFNWYLLIIPLTVLLVVVCALSFIIKKRMKK
jgi:lipopolysaccharide export LptBFGC system permease protein LptF